MIKTSLEFSAAIQEFSNHDLLVAYSHTLLCLLHDSPTFKITMPPNTFSNDYEIVGCSNLDHYILFPNNVKIGYNQPVHVLKEYILQFEFEYA